jgi:hypothetical protein
MGERLAKELGAVWKAKVEQVPEFHNAMAGGADTREVITLLLELVWQMHESMVWLAGQVDDPA